MPKGYLAVVLHAHLPYVRHPEYDEFLEERWFFEALTETYIPIVMMLDRFVKESVPCRLTVSLSPSLLAMMEDPLLQDRYAAHLERSIQLSEHEVERHRDNPHVQYLAGVYGQLFRDTREVFVKQYQTRISAAFKKFAEQGVIELITCAATHGLLPLLAPHPKSVAAQVITGLEYFEEIFGFRAQGFWLPECGYYPHLDDILWQEGVRYFLTESHGVEHASTTPLYGVYTPLYTPSGAAAFGRDQGSTKQVWSAREGFPGDPDYREFYRDIGYDVDYDYIQPYLAGGVRCDTGFKYHRITGPTPWKDWYHPDVARERAAQHADAFLRQRVSHVEYLDSAMETTPIIVAPFDAELFGHWWFEGPQWLEFLIRKTVYDQDTIALASPGGYLDRHPVHQSGVPCTSTWGHKGYFAGWLNEQTDWIYPQLLECSLRMEQLVQAHGTGTRVTPLTHRVLQQCMRELLLAQGSDWPFIINDGTSTEYAARRVKDHVARFHALADALAAEAVHEETLAALEYLDNPFPNVDYTLFA